MILFWWYDLSENRLFCSLLRSDTFNPAIRVKNAPDGKFYFLSKCESFNEYCTCSNSKELELYKLQVPYSDRKLYDFYMRI